MTPNCFQYFNEVIEPIFSPNCSLDEVGDVQNLLGKYKNFDDFFVGNAVFGICVPKAFVEFIEKVHINHPINFV